MDEQARAVLRTLERLVPKSNATADDAIWLADFRYKTALLGTFGGPPEQDVEISHRVVGDVPIRLYRPGSGRLPMLFHIHGGGAIAGSLDVHDTPLRLLAKSTGWLVAAPDYRLAPAHRFPTQLHDCYDALIAISADPSIDPARIVVGGDSIGGAIAAALSMLVRDRSGPRLAGQMLLYPNTDLRADASYTSRRSEDGIIISAADLERQIALYVADEQDRRSPLASPILAEHLQGLPPAFVATAEHDSLRDEGEAYVHRLRDAEVDVSHHRYGGMIHAFLQMSGEIDRTRCLIDDLKEWLVAKCDDKRVS